MGTTEHDKEWLTTAEASELTGLSRSTIRRRVDSGELEGHQHPNGFRIKRSTLESAPGEAGPLPGADTATAEALIASKLAGLPLLVDIPTAAPIIGMTEWALYEACRVGDVPAETFGKRRVRIPLGILFEIATGNRAVRRTEVA